jgi:hypothetical protein
MKRLSPEITSGRGRCDPKSRRLHQLNRYGKDQQAPRGQRARHAIKGNKVNVGDPNGSSKEVLSNECKSEELEKAIRESDGL